MRPSRRTSRFFNLLARARPLSVTLARAHARLNRRTNGRFMGRWLGAPVLVIETLGRRSGKVRRTPIIYLRDGTDIVVAPANAGNDRTPAWWLNLSAAGSGVVIDRGERRPVQPRVLEGADRERAWREAVRQFPALGDYETFTEREIPLAVLEPAD